MGLGWKIFFSVTVLALLIPGLTLDFMVPGSTWARKSWSLIEIFLTVMVFLHLWRRKPIFQFLADLANAPLAKVNLFLARGLFVVLTLDLLRLAIGQGYFGPPAAPYLEALNPSFLSVVLISLTVAHFINCKPLPIHLVFFVVVVLVAHQFLLWLSKDIFLARFQAAIWGALVLFAPGRLKLKLWILAFVILIWGSESLVLSSTFYQNLKWPWPDPQADQLSVAYDVFLSQAAIYASGDWGLGLSYFDKLDLFRPGPIAAYALPYLTVWLGAHGASLYLALQAVFYSALSFGSQKIRLSWPRVAFFCLSCLLTANLLLGVLAATGAMGYYDPLGIAFVGNNQVGALSLVLVLILTVWSKVPADS
ncbi:MAG: hypothetical protein LBI10_10505 [Deltaproteobacteria bacterium]|nr:hypothetical protein [Deltaproteobacteria bacterium]